MLLSVVLAAVSALLVTTTIATAGSTMMKPADQWIDSIWAKQLDGLKGEKDVVLTMLKGVCGVRELEIVQIGLKRLEGRVGSIWGDAVFVINCEEQGKFPVFDDWNQNHQNLTNIIKPWNLISQFAEVAHVNSN